MPTPDEIQAVYGLLQQAASQNPQQLQLAYQQLQEWEKHPGFFTAIQEVFRNTTVDVNIRQLAIIYFKNGIDRYWRKRAPNGISEEEKEQLRVALLATTLNEGIPQLFKQLAYLVSKAARHDWPRDWPALLPTLAQTISNPDTPRRRLIALMTLHHVIKALASKTLSKTAFREVALQFSAGLVDLWRGYVMSDNSHCPEAHHCAKILRRLICYGFSDLSEMPNAADFLGMVLERINTFTQQWHQTAVPSEGLETSIKLLMKIVLETRSHHPMGYCPFLPSSLQLCLHHVMNAHDTGRLHETFLIQCCRFIKDTVEETEYNPDTNGADGQAAHQVVRTVLTDDTIGTLAHTLAARYLVLPKSALQHWEDDPEEFAYENTDLSLFELQPCSESLFKAMVGPYPKLMNPLIMDLLNSTKTPIDPSNLGSVLMRDAIYNTAGLAAYDLYGILDFPRWVMDHFTPELNVHHANYKIIRRRIAWLVEQWADVCKFPDEVQTHVYAMLLALQGPTEDMAVRLAANTALRSTIDSMNFRIATFKPYLSGSIEHIFQLLASVSEGDTKMKILSTLTIVLARNRAEMVPYAGVIAGAMPRLWQEAQAMDNNMLQCTLVGVLKNLVEAIGPESVNYQDLLLPIIEFSTNKENKAHVYLMEDGTLLWRIVVQATTHPSPNLLSLFPRAVASLDSVDCVKYIISIINSYVILSPTILETYGSHMAAAFLEVLNSFKAEGLRLLADVIDTCLIAYREPACLVFEKCLMLMMTKMATNAENDEVLVHYASIYSRVLVQHPECFDRLLAHCASNLALPAPPMAILMSCWLDKLDSNSDHRQLKLTGLGLMMLVGRQEPLVLEQFGLVVNACVQVYCAMKLDEAKDDFLTWGDDPDHWSPEPGEAPEVTRERQLKRMDVVHRVSLYTALNENLQRLQAANPNLFASLMANLDPVISEQLRIALA